ncbi:alpha/beta fold hydrolase [Acinetobacter pullicarnis]|uniref:alpha/beta fold hydrolase n=1 Tax=Acinetobacter pullicarnis TaxID=2576829 RepID=UPI0011243960|nr:alpha/beta fold hydrolase [Acinetobacter pullicarnis]
MSAIKQKMKQQQDKLKNLSKRLFDSKSLILSQQTPYQIIAEWDHIRVRYYAATERKYLEPLVFVAPLAINMSIYDLFPYRSLIQYFTQIGFEVYLVDWGEMNYQHRHLNFLSFVQDYIPQCIQQIQQHANSEKISLHGWSMAGIFVMLYTARQQPQIVKNLMVLGSPIDSYASGYLGKLIETSNAVIQRSEKLKKTLYSGKLPTAFIHSPAKLNAIGFKIINPKSWYDGQKQLLLNLDKTQNLQEHATLAHFLNHMIDYPGGIVQDMLFNIWLQNPLKNGWIELQDQMINLKAINCSLLIGAGTNDQIVTAAAAQPLENLTSSTDVTYRLIPGGHLGLMSSKKSADKFWPFLADWLKQRSTALNTA